jgi:hypothetical protein
MVRIGFDTKHVAPSFDESREGRIELALTGSNLKSKSAAQVAELPTVSSRYRIRYLGFWVHKHRKRSGVGCQLRRHRDVCALVVRFSISGATPHVSACLPRTRDPARLAARRSLLGGNVVVGDVRVGIAGHGEEQRGVIFSCSVRKPSEE